MVTGIYNIKLKIRNLISIQFILLLLSDTYKLIVHDLPKQ